MKQKNFLKIAMFFLIAIISNQTFGQVFITEIADPNDSASARYVEIYNQGDSSVDLSDWALRRWTNDNSSPQTDKSLSGTIASKGFIVFVASTTGFNTAFSSFSGTSIQLGTGGPVDSNGDDNVALIDNNGTLVDMFGVAGEDGSGTCHEFEDGRAERKATVITAKSTWSEADWNIWADSTILGCTSHTNDPQNTADGDFDPGTWIGEPVSNDPIVTFDSATSTETEIDATFTSANIPISVTNYNGNQINIDVAITGGTVESGDYSYTTQSLSFSSNSTQNITIDINDDADQENETIIFTITETSSVTGLVISQTIHTLTITDNDLPSIIINELLADPGSVVDANGDGVFSSTNDEFIEFVNTDSVSFDLTGYTVEDSGSVTYTFGAITIPAGGSVVIFGGGIPTGIPGITDTASGLSLNNSGDTVYLKNADGTIITTYTYGSEANSDESIGRSSDLTGVFVKHETISSNPVSASPGRYNTTGEPFSTNTWTGATDTSWTTATNWSLGSVPGSGDDVQIINTTNQPIASGVVTVNSVTIASGSTLTAQSTFTGSVTYNRTLGTSNWYLVSSPVSGEIMTDMRANNSFDTGSGTNIGFATYNPGQTDTAAWTYFTSSSTDALSDGIGYSAKLDSSGDISFTGTINTADVETPSLTTGYNLIGNPYTSYISSKTFLEAGTSSNIDQTQIWLWNENLDMYEVKPSGTDWVLAPAQGFFVNANSGGKVTFEKTNQATSGNIFQKTSKTTLELWVSDGENKRYAKIDYTDNGTNGFDYGFEGEVFGGISSSFSAFTSLLQDDLGKKYQVQTLPNSGYENMIIPVGIEAAAGKEITFSVEALNLPTEIKVFLEDRLTNTFTRLDETNSEYKITLTEALNGVGRFYIHTAQSTLSTDDVILNSVSIYKTNASTLKIAGLPQGKASISLYNILGKEMMSASFTSNGNKEISLSKLSSGVYVAKVKTEKGVISKKIILE
jgi:hypothetical protein